MANDYFCSREPFHRVAPEDWAAHLLAEEGSREKVLVRTVRELIEAGDAIRCYPSGAVGFDNWGDAMEAAEFVLKQFLDEDGNWHPMEALEDAVIVAAETWRDGEWQNDDINDGRLLDAVDALRTARAV